MPKRNRNIDWRDDIIARRVRTAWGRTDDDNGTPPPATPPPSNPAAERVRFVHREEIQGEAAPDATMRAIGEELMKREAA